MHTFRFVRLALSAAILVGTAIACGGGDPTYVPTPNPDVYRGTQAPGDVWSYTLGTTTFTATNETLGHDYGGTIAELDNGYLKLNVTSSDNPDLIGKLPVPCHALEVPGVALILKPAEQDGNVVVCVAVDEKPTEDTTYNYVKFPDPDWDDGLGGIDDEEVWGRATSSMSGPSETQFDFWIEYWTMGNTTGTPSQTEWADQTFTATGGWLVPDVGDQRVGITPPGLFVQDSGPLSGGAMGVAAPSAPMGLDALFAADRDFLGFVFEYAPAGENTEPVWATVSQGDDYVAVGPFTTPPGGFDDAVRANEQGRITLASELTRGVFRGALTQPGPDDIWGTADDESVDLVLMCGDVANRYFVFGLIEPNDAGHNTMNILLIEQ